MNKAELIDAIATDTNFSKKDTDLFLRAFIENVSKALEGGDSVHLLGFGTFDVSERAARDCRNPKTGEKIHVPNFHAGEARLHCEIDVITTKFNTQIWYNVV